MFSAPTARPIDVSPDRMACAIFLIAMSPDEHKRFTVDIGTLAGIPAANAAPREMYSGDGG